MIVTETYPAVRFNLLATVPFFAWAVRFTSSRKTLSAESPLRSNSAITKPAGSTAIAAAGKRHCDSIFMASHGRRGVKRLLLGSVASRVIATSSVPVVVYR